MKKSIFVVLFVIFTIFSSFAEDHKFELLKVYEQNKESGLFFRDNNTLYGDDFSAENIIIDENGDLYIYQNETCRMIFLDKKLNIQKQMKLNVSNEAFSIRCNKNVFFITNSFGTINSINENGEKKFHCSMFNINGTSNKTFIYYDEETDILFLQDKNEQLYSIINPGLDEEQNKKNFKNPEETSREFENGKTVNGVNVKVVDSKYLYINNNFIYFGQEKVGNYVYTKNREDYFLYNKNTKEYFNIYFSSEDEELESTAIHPSGDIYVLRMNWTTNTHNLYRIVNTWDPECREQWYKEHPEAE